MKKFGFGKKSADDGDDANRNALFGRKKSSPAPNSPPAPQSDNPYARQAPANDPYTSSKPTTAYQQARAGLNNPGGAPGPNGGGYGNNQYGSGGGYGSNRYESPAAQNPYSAGSRVSGYGGLGGNEPDSNRDALFAGAQERYEQKQQRPPPAYPDAGGSAAGGDYGGYGEQRELTAEEQEEQEVQAILAEKRAVQQESANSVNRSVLMARQANEVGRATLARLGAQGERLHNTEKNLDLAANQNKIAQDKAAELKTLNRSMFAVHVGNPFTSKERQARADEAVMKRHHDEREARENTRREGFAANQRMEDSFRAFNTAGARQKQTTKKGYGKYNLDDEDDDLEDQIDDGLGELESQVKMMNMVGKAIGKEVDAQNKMIDRITQKSDAVDDATRMNRERLARIN
ncbi:unnamed protein product [Clonostachys rhizophaga]|uniref:t-SNARE coiled-coil homology domain-containing protein n=1 Tax=Clonostachys rhizophaga TaxID=160324 RepID=A0A9N9VJS0_9HYPO|nr:unnamed protein product [Clonostachys rhizophaga]